ncbi:MAG: tRNA (N6-isopentenyl adenosine(37)-C2)-methylthiotransferase MiaB [Tissierellia bacterium]|nr:tRNA (N6-isopentenyl adenosine(37)-C2)-methylthiotransferase MiaB [Tissierellia bacterium]
MKYKIITYGCQANEHDSERIAFILEKLGYSKTEKEVDADFIVYNTCLIRENAELKVFGHLGAIKKLKREKPEMIVAVSGCMMQTGEAKDVIREKYPHVDIIFGTGNIDKLPELISLHKSTNQLVVDIDKYMDDNTFGYSRNHTFSAYVNIMTGCNNFCTYCVVPYARGREVSRPVEDIIEEIKELADSGYKEVTLLGQNVNSYGKDIGTTFPELLYEIDKHVKNLPILRFMTSHPKDLSDELIEAMSKIDMIAKHFHLPLQSGSTKVLKEMNRKYSSDHYLVLVRKLREKMPDISITTDIIVGFPGETEEDNQMTIDICKEVEFDNAFTFIYSMRPGTPAAERKDQVNEKDKSRRFNELLKVIYPIFNKKNKQELGKIHSVLLESVSKNNEEMISGRTLSNKLVHVKANKDLIGNIVKVKITKHTSFTLEGELID